MSAWQELTNLGDVIDEASLLALCLCNHAAGEPVRSLEAIACTFLNRKQSNQALVDAMTELSPPSLEPPLSAAQRDKSLLVARRVARRALNGGLTDVTNGANAFHHIDHDPEWAKNASLVHSEGNYLFFSIKLNAQATPE